VDLQLTGRRALVTGGSRGIGKAVAAALLAEGAEVAIAAVIAFLASPLSVSINGESIACGGGIPGVIHY
jgi:NADP-dependent 3-hydroxy acid dehydrogenase YdfG